MRKLRTLAMLMILLYLVAGIHRMVTHPALRMKPPKALRVRPLRRGRPTKAGIDLARRDP